MTPFRVARPQIAEERERDLRSWRNFGRPLDEREGDPRDKRLCCTTNKDGKPCGAWGTHWKGDLRYCWAHYIPGAERR